MLLSDPQDACESLAYVDQPMGTELNSVEGSILEYESCADGLIRGSMVRRCIFGQLTGSPPICSGYCDVRPLLDRDVKVLVERQSSNQYRTPDSSKITSVRNDLKMKLACNNNKRLTVNTSLEYTCLNQQITGADGNIDSSFIDCIEEATPVPRIVIADPSTTNIDWTDLEPPSAMTATVHAVNPYEKVYKLHSDKWVEIAASNSHFSMTDSFTLFFLMHIEDERSIIEWTNSDLNDNVT